MSDPRLSLDSDFASEGSTSKPPSTSSAGNEAEADASASANPSTTTNTNTSPLTSFLLTTLTGPPSSPSYISLLQTLRKRPDPEVLLQMLSALSGGGCLGELSRNERVLRPSQNKEI
ncbi:hypothetical protein TrLO_g3341 [Triparma laevis f. longispina]|uniref:Uncharacterized protein n=1 Tax=Triparma laevis f. longispina TaxID=1714387 RepID=A0A9W7KY02_9STRA|nr:hypothetical protein TrLO_g3341 [Triparma laevis f. longispina]